MPKIESEKPRLGISACLLGERVRYDGGNKRDPFLTATLGPFVEWVPVCPESRSASACPARRLGLDGYVLKRASPSCGAFRVLVYHADGRPRGRAAGSTPPCSSVACRVCPWKKKAGWATPPRTRDLAAYHAAHEDAVLVHSPPHYPRLGRLVAAAGPRLTGEALDAYGALLMEALAVRATRARDATVLRHAASVLERALGPDERAELGEVVDAYGAGSGTARNAVHRPRRRRQPSWARPRRTRSAALSPDLTQSAMPTPP
ncbi:MAG: hypothetical protein AUH81_04690 [Candidatus Rokubacteria bacterium 13_1_40CM_4_69_5]|nr:MAG: hypothetical protein AUH81_04690 [Candidatus Rokubacteria bacterium 13_1_40CM_4_69_5]OLE39656.1 MAG: hypothetical protein AUG00_01260 [Candidatus Rokubacteria bacterium 13_1_20CM_2_70_7]